MLLHYQRIGIGLKMKSVHVIDQSEKNALSTDSSLCLMQNTDNFCKHAARMSGFTESSYKFYKL